MTILYSTTLINATTTEISAWDSHWVYGQFATTGPNSGLPMLQVTSTGGTVVSGSTANQNWPTWVAYTGVTFPADQWVQATFTTVVSIGMCLVLRGSPIGAPTNAGACLYLMPSTSNTTLYYMLATGQASVSVASTASVLAAAGDVWKAQIQGNNWSVWRNDMVNVAWSGTLPAAAQVITAGSAGLGAAGNGTGLQNWSAGNLLAGPVAPTTAKGGFNIRTTSQP